MASSENKTERVAYFTMEIGLESEMSTYSGGLGILAGDVVRSFADLETPAVCITQLNRKGYCKQKLNDEGDQIDSPDEWNHEKFLEKLPVRASVQVEGREVKVSAWRRYIEGDEGFTVPVIFLDTNLEENDERDRRITDRLYGGGQRYRLAQEIVLGIGGARILKELGYRIRKYHMNEGHSALLTLELLKEHDMNHDPVRELCAFTTHTPVAGGHDEFSYDLVKEVLGDLVPLETLKKLSSEDCLHMTILALNLSGYHNAVSKRHEEVSGDIFPDHSFDSITNGVHVPTWTSESFEEVYDEHLPGWRSNPSKLRHATRVPGPKLWEAHQKEKGKLIDLVNERKDIGMSEDILTLGFARRAAPYKRADLMFYDIEKLTKISEEAGDFQAIFAGISHPKVESGKELIREIYQYAEELRDRIKIAYLEDYDMNMGKIMTSGSDVWLNNPDRPREACGTSGMKAALNGVPQLATLDGWWIEGHLEGKTGWSIGPSPRQDGEEYSDEEDAKNLYNKLENSVIPKFYEDRDGWIELMRNSISFNGAHFSSRRMVQEYISNAYSG